MEPVESFGRTSRPSALTDVVLVLIAGVTTAAVHISLRPSVFVEVLLLLALLYPVVKRRVLRDDAPFWRYAVKAILGATVAQVVSLVWR